MMVRSPAISAHKRRSLSQRARRDAEAEQRDPAPAYPPHGTVVGEVVLRLLGHEVRAELLSTGRHCRSYGVRIEGEVIGVMGADAAWREVSRRMQRMLSIRRMGA